MTTISSSYDPHERGSRPRPYNLAEDVLARPWVMFAASVATMPGPSSHRASAGTRAHRRAASSITIDLA
jgi:hypothetical protein